MALLAAIFHAYFTKYLSFDWTQRKSLLFLSTSFLISLVRFLFIYLEKYSEEFENLEFMLCRFDFDFNDPIADFSEAILGRETTDEQL